MGQWSNGQRVVIHTTVTDPTIRQPGPSYSLKVVVSENGAR